MSVDQDQHLKRPGACQRCSWVGISGDLIASGRSPDLHCPKCGEAEIKYLISDAPAMKQ